MWRPEDDLRFSFDSTFEQIAYGTFPWGILGPVAIAALIASPQRNRRILGAITTAQAAVFAAAQVLDFDLGGDEEEHQHGQQIAQHAEVALGRAECDAAVARNEKKLGRGVVPLTARALTQGEPGPHQGIAASRDPSHPGRLSRRVEPWRETVMYARQLDQLKRGEGVGNECAIGERHDRTHARSRHEPLAHGIGAHGVEERLVRGPGTGEADHVHEVAAAKASDMKDQLRLVNTAVPWALT